MTIDSAIDDPILNQPLGALALGLDYIVLGVAPAPASVAVGSLWRANSDGELQGIRIDSACEGKAITFAEIDQSMPRARCHSRATRATRCPGWQSRSGCPGTAESGRVGGEADGAARGYCGCS